MLAGKSITTDKGVEMDTNQLRFIGTGLFFLFIFLSGYWLRHSGKPYNVIVLTIHKLISVAGLVLLVIIMIRSNQGDALSTIELIVGVFAGLSFLSLIVTGGLLSSKKEMPAIVSKLHKIAPYLTVFFTVATLFLLRGREL